MTWGDLLHAGLPALYRCCACSCLVDARRADGRSVGMSAACRMPVGEGRRCRQSILCRASCAGSCASRASWKYKGRALIRTTGGKREVGRHRRRQMAPARRGPLTRAQSRRRNHSSLPAPPRLPTHPALRSPLAPRHKSSARRRSAATERPTGRQGAPLPSRRAPSVRAPLFFPSPPSLFPQRVPLPIQRSPAPPRPF